MTSVIIAIIGVVGVSVPPVIAALTGESRRIRNLASQVDLFKALPDEMRIARQHLTDSITSGTSELARPPLPTWQLFGSLSLLSVAIGGVLLAANARSLTKTPTGEHQLVAVGIAIAGIAYIIGLAGTAMSLIRLRLSSRRRSLARSRRGR